MNIWTWLAIGLLSILLLGPVGPVIVMLVWLIMWAAARSGGTSK